MIELEKLPNSVPEERVEIFLRRHWIDLLKIFLFTAGLLVVPVAVIAVAVYSEASFLVDPFWQPVAMLLLSAYLLIVLMLTMTELTDYWLDVWIVTSERIINTEQHGLFNRTVSEVHLEQIQDITSETHGFLETFLTFGDVFIQTAAERERFQFKNIDNPDDVKLKISALVATCKTGHHHDPRAIAPGLGMPGGKTSP